MKHVVVYEKEQKYAGWPANYGMWNRGDEMVVGFVVCSPDPNSEFHARSRSKPFETMLARSIDGGLTWHSEPFSGVTPGGRALSADEHMEPSLQAESVMDTFMEADVSDMDVDCTDPSFALMCARTNLHAGTRAWYYVSEDLCRTWKGPVFFPSYGLPGIAARTDYTVLGPKSLLLFLTAAADTEKGSRIFCVRSDDGAKSFRFWSWVSQNTPNGYDIMPAGVRMGDGAFLAAIRERRLDAKGVSHHRIGVYRSSDDAKTWQRVGVAVDDTGEGGNPPTLLRLDDDHAVMTYGYRKAPFGIRALILDAKGLPCGDQIVLRADGGSSDLGYPRTIQRADGRLVTAYYFTRQPQQACHIAATIWKP